MSIFEIIHEAILKLIDMLRVLARTGRLVYGVKYTRAFLEDQATDWEAIRKKEA